MSGVVTAVTVVVDDVSEGVASWGGGVGAVRSARVRGLAPGSRDGKDGGNCLVAGMCAVNCIIAS